MSRSSTKEDHVISLVDRNERNWKNKLGNIASLAMSLLAGPKYYYTYKGIHAKGVDTILQELITLISSALWVLDTLVKPIPSVFIMVCNAIGILIQAIYLLIFIWYADTERKKSAIKLVLITIVVSIPAALFPILLFQGFVLYTTLQVFSGITTVCIYIIPLYTMVKALWTNAVEAFSVYSPVIIAINPLAWMLYGFESGDTKTYSIEIIHHITDYGIDKLISEHNINMLYIVQKVRKQTANHDRPTLHGNNVRSYQVFYTAQFV